MQTPYKLLLVEDNTGLVAVLREALQAEYQLEATPSGKNALYKADISGHDCVILDLQLPDMSGLDVCQQLRERGLSVPILILTADTKVLSKINLLDAGANDYLTKPFSLGELKARLRVLLRASATTPPPRPIEPLQVGDLRLNRATHEVVRQGEAITLRRKEFLLLEYLMQHAGSVVSRENLVRYAWQSENAPWANTIDVHIKHLRDKIDRPFSQPVIYTVHGVGYKLQAASALPEAVSS